MAKQYVCRLVMRVVCEEPDEAPPLFVRYLVEGGLTQWIYRVEDAETQEIVGYFDGDGLPVDFDTSPTEEGDEEQEQTTVQTVDLPSFGGLEVDVTTAATPSQNDEALLDLAESLNDEDET